MYIVSAIFLLLNSALLQFIALLLILFLGISYFRYNALHPFVWLSFSVFIYNVSFCLLDIFGILRLDYIHEILNCTFISIVSYFTFFFLFLRNFSMNYSTSFINKDRARVLYILLFVLGVIMIFYLPLFVRSGYASKKEMNLDGGLPFFGIISRFYFLIYTLYLTYFCHKYKRIPKNLILINIIIALGAALIIGERDVFLTICLLTFFVYYKYFKVSFSKVILFGIVGLISVAVLQTTKQITNKEKINLPMENMFLAIFGGEFATSGSNLYVLLSNEKNWNYQYGIAIKKDLGRAIVPDYISRQENSTRWFNQKFNPHLDSGYGMGFSFIGEGYLQFGYWGVFIWSFLLALLSLILYSNAQKHIYGFVAYIYMISVTFYAMRGDFSYIISPLLKQVYLSYLVLLFVFKFVKKNRNELLNIKKSVTNYH